MKDEEYLLLMVTCEGRAIGFEAEHILTTEERARLHSVGIQTAQEQPAWSSIEPHKGEYNWAYTDKIIKRNRDAGLKTMLQISGWRVPLWCPNEWRARRKDGHYEEEQLSIWNEEAERHSDLFYKIIQDHYPDEDVGFFFGEFQGGEGALPPTWCIYDQAALDDYKDVYGSSAEPIPDSPETLDWMGKKIIQHYLRKAELLYSRNKELWNEQQWLMNQWGKAFGNYVQPDILKEFRNRFPDATIYLLQYTYFDSSHPPENEIYVDMLRDISGCEVIAEAMFCKGLATTTPKSIVRGFRGQIVRPANEIGATRMEDWELDAIRKSHELWSGMIK
jgi:hypothetical protein